MACFAASAARRSNRVWVLAQRVLFLQDDVLQKHRLRLMRMWCIRVRKRPLFLSRVSSASLRIVMFDCVDSSATRLSRKWIGWRIL